ncbi:MAG: hypothetical protein IT372_29360 [Polyangiaceae bacterium]|nr:hypothetical protein [Polyangiaceae bacterium]
MNRTLLALGLSAAAALSAGCEEPPKGAPTAGSAAPAAALTDQDVPLPSDFEDEAEKSITPANYKAEADAIEKEIDAP